jgi:hypothetical protein
LLAGQPGAAAGIAGLDLLQSPGEIAASKGGKARAVSNATDAVIEAKALETKAQATVDAAATTATAKVEASRVEDDAELKAQQEADALELAQALRLEFFKNPELVIAGFEAAGENSAGLSQALMIKEDTFDPFAMRDHSRHEAERLAALDAIDKAMAETENPELHKALAMQRMDLSMPGYKIPQDVKENIYKNVGDAGVTWTELAGDLKDVAKPQSYWKGQTAYLEGKGGLFALGKLVPRDDKTEYEVGQSEEVNEAQVILENEYAKLLEVVVDPKTGKETILEFPDVNIAIDNIKDPAMRGIARDNAHNWNYPDTITAQNSLFAQVYPAIEIERLKTNEERIEANGGTADGLFDLIPPEESVAAATRAVADIRFVNNKAVSRRVARNVSSLKNVITTDLLIPYGTANYDIVMESAYAAAAVMLGPVTDESEIYAEAARLIKADTQKYMDMVKPKED